MVNIQGTALQLREQRAFQVTIIRKGVLCKIIFWLWSFLVFFFFHLNYELDALGPITVCRVTA